MKERQSRSPNSFFFLFICPEDRLGEVRKEIDRIGGISVDPNSYQAKGSLTIDCGKETKIREGFRVTGIAFSNSLNHLAIALTEKEIAGHSQEAPIVHHRGDVVRPKKIF